MIRRVEVTRRAETQARRLPVSRAYRAFYRLARDEDVELVSIEEVNKHDY